jgi:uncharacterized membrane protein
MAMMVGIASSSLLTKYLPNQPPTNNESSKRQPVSTWKHGLSLTYLLMYFGTLLIEPHRRHATSIIEADILFRAMAL